MNKFTTIRLVLTDEQMALVISLAKPSDARTNTKRVKFILNKYVGLLKEPDDKEVLRKIKVDRLLLKDIKK